MEKNQLLALVLVPLLLLSLAATSTMFVVHLSAQEEGEEEPATVTPPAGFGSATAPEPATTATTTAINESAAAAADFVRARVQIFGIPANSPDLVAWINVPGLNESATGAGSINYTELEASNNVTNDGMGEMFMALPNVTSALNQQIQACVLNVADLTPACDNAITTNATASTVLQILLGKPEAARTLS